MEYSHQWSLPESTSSLIRSCEECAEFDQRMFLTSLMNRPFSVVIARDDASQQSVVLSRSNLIQPLAAIDAYKKSSLQYPGDPSVRLGIARVAAAIGDEPASIEVYKEYKESL